MSLGFTLENLRDDCSRLLGFTGDYSGDTSADQSMVDDVIKEGLRQFYWPPRLSPEIRPHKWKFLEPVGFIHLRSGQDTVYLGPEVGAIEGKLVYGPDESSYHEIEQVTRMQILDLRNRNSTNVTGYPYFVSTQPVDYDGFAEQHLKLEFYPEASEDLMIRFKYTFNPSELTDTKKYPAGGIHHAETVRASIRAAAELRVTDQPGPYYQKFLERLDVSIAMDSRTKAENMGYNGDRSDQTAGGLHGFFYADGNVSYGGTIYKGS